VLSGRSAANGFEPWRLELDGQGNVRRFEQYDIFPGATGSVPHFITTVNSRFVFSADNGQSGRELWGIDTQSTNGIRPKLLRNIWRGANDSFPQDFQAFDGGLIFSAINYRRGRELWWTDGYRTSLYADLIPGRQGSGPIHIITTPQRAIAQAELPGFSRELYIITK